MKYIKKSPLRKDNILDFLEAELQETEELLKIHAGSSSENNKTQLTPNLNIYNQEKVYEFGVLYDGKLKWTAKKNQLTYAIYKIHDKLGLETINGYSIKEFIIKSNKIENIGNENTLRIYLEQLIGKKQEFGEDKYVNEASQILLNLLKNQNE